MKLVDANDIAKMLKMKDRHVKERLIFTDGFPDCFDLAKDKRLWDLKDIEKWVRSHRKPVNRKKRQSKSSAISSADSA